MIHVERQGHSYNETKLNGSHQIVINQIFRLLLLVNFILFNGTFKEGKHSQFDHCLMQVNVRFIGSLFFDRLSLDSRFLHRLKCVLGIQQWLLLLIHVSFWELWCAFVLFIGFIIFINFKHRFINARTLGIWLVENDVHALAILSL